MTEPTSVRLDSVDALLHPWSRVHASGAAVHLAMVDLSHVGEVLHGAVDEAMRGDGVQASHSLNLCKSLTVLLRPDAVATTRARSRHSSAGLACVELERCHDARVSRV